MNTESTNSLINQMYLHIAEEDLRGKCYVSASFLLDVINELEEKDKQIRYLQEKLSKS